MSGVVFGSSGGGAPPAPLASSFPIDADLPAVLSTSDAVTYGVDVSTVPGLDPMFRLIDGRRAVAEVVARRYSTPNGALLDDPDFGLDVRGLLNESLDAATLYRWRAAMATEALKDERVLDADVAFAADLVAGTLRVTIALTLADGPFTLVLGIGQLTVELLQVFP